MLPPQKSYNIILRLKCTKFDFGWGSAPDPAGAAYSAPQTPQLDLMDPTSKKREGKGKGEKEGEQRGRRKGEEKEGEVESWLLADGMDAHVRGLQCKITSGVLICDYLIYLAHCSVGWPTSGHSIP